MSRFREPLLLPVCAFAGGIAAAHNAAIEGAYLIPAIAVVSALWLLTALRGYRATIVPACAAIGLAGALLYELRRPEAPPRLDASPGEIVLISGCIIEPPQADDELQRFTLELAPRARVSVTLALREGERALPLAYGRMAEVEAKIRKPRNFRNPGSFDYEGYLAQRNVHWLASARGAGSVQLADGVCGSAANRLIASIRAWSVDRLRSLYSGDAPTAALLAALLIGDDARVQKGWTEAFRITGTYHALVISGLHITVVAGALFTLLRLAAAPLLLSFAISAGAAWLYAGVAAWEPPAVRSAAGFTLFLLSRVMFRRGRLLNVLAATALLFLVVDPPALFSASFQLSFLAVVGVGALAAPASERTLTPYRSALRQLWNPASDVHHGPAQAQFRIEMRLLAETAALMLQIPARWMMRVQAAALSSLLLCAELGLLTLLVQLALAVPSVVYFHRLSVTGLLANLVVPTALTFAVPIGLLAVVTQLAIFAYPARLLLDVSRYVAELFAGLEPLWRIPTPSPIWSIAFCLGVLVFAVALRRGKQIRISAVICLAGSMLLIWQPFRYEPLANVLSMSTLDVGQGDSIFIEMPDGKTMLMDAGGLPSFNPKAPPRLDIGEDVVSPYLWHHGLRRLDVVAVSHLHDDHARGLPAILRNFQPAELWAGGTPDCSAWKEIQAQAARVGTKLRLMRAGDRVQFGKATVGVLAPSRDHVPRDRPHNDDSLVLHLQMGVHDFLLTGDLERRGELSLAEADLIPDIDVLKVGHHGSKTSTTEALLDAARPRFALISSGAGNLYGHPNPVVLDRLWQLGTKTYRTDLEGMVRITTNGRHLRITTGENTPSQAPVFSGLP